MTAIYYKKEKNYDNKRRYSTKAVYDIEVCVDRC